MSYQDGTDDRFYTLLAARRRERSERLAKMLQIESEDDRRKVESMIRATVAEIRNELTRQFGMIAMREFCSEELQGALDELAVRIGTLIHGIRTNEGFEAARKNAGTMLTALAAGAKIARERPEEGTAIEATFGSLLERAEQGGDPES